MDVYTDGACRNNPGGPGGWAWVVDENRYGYGGTESTTNQRMEVQAAIEAMKALSKVNLVVYSDSKYLVNCASGRWKRKANRDVWDDYEGIFRRRKKLGLSTTFKWVKGHSGVRLNEIADRLATVGLTGRGLDRAFSAGSSAGSTVSAGSGASSTGSSATSAPAKHSYAFPAKYAGLCWFCGGPFAVGEQITAFRAEGDTGWGHVDPCFPAWRRTYHGLD